MSRRATAFELRETEPPPFHARLALASERRLVTRLITRAEEAFGLGDRVGFDTFSAAAAHRLDVDTYGLDQPAILRALRSAYQLKAGGVR